MEKTALTTLVLDREQLERNPFWKAIVDKVKEQRNIALGELETGISLPIDKLRYYQGRLAAWELFKDLPDLILDDLRRLEEKE